jgi:hypothetical protein
MLRSLVIASLLFALWLSPTLAQSGAAPITVERAWARATPGNVTTGGAYMTLVDHGATSDRLVGVSTPVAGKAELHMSMQDGGIMKMHGIAGVTVEPGRSIELKPGGYHVMLLELSKPLKEGDSFPMTLMFEKAGSIQVMVKVEKAGAMGPSSSGTSAMPGMKM